MNIYIVKLFAENSRGRLAHVLDEALEQAGIEASDTVVLNSAERFRWIAETGLLKNGRIFFAVELDESGVNIDGCRLLQYLNICGDALAGSVSGVIVDGCGELYTKDLGRKLVFEANRAGCTFPGKPLVEATGSLQNFDVLAGNWKTTRLGAYKKSCSLLIDKVLSFRMPQTEHPSVLVVHASSRKTSNSLRLWSEISQHLEGMADIEEISIRNGQVWDCRGCKYEECLHFGENSTCFYGGVMVEKVYPAILKSDILVLICPNYNDSVSANIMAFINRLTSVFRTNDFSRKKVFAIVVSGYSGGDIVAQQIISAMNMNKNFILPAGFVMMETANNPGSVMKIDDIEEKAKLFAEKILGKEHK